jgi:pimeloyl-ACP methyl ester carboxylesterase
VIGAEASVVVAHDRGDSVALLHAARCAEGRSAVRLEHLVLSNGNIFLPLSNLTEAQRRLLDSSSGPQIAVAPTPSQLADCDTVSPPRVASYVWNEYLMLKPGGNRLYFIPDANHYLQIDRPDAFVKVLLHTLDCMDSETRA